jgi:plasmid stability protein
MEAIADRQTMAEWRIRNLPERVRKALRLWAVEDEVAMNALIIQLLTAAVDKRGKGR